MLSNRLLSREANCSIARIHTEIHCPTESGGGWMRPCDAECNAVMYIDWSAVCLSQLVDVASQLQRGGTNIN